MNKVVHFEIPFDDQERATKFYSEIFGWEMIDMPEMKYVMARTAPVDDKNMVKEPGAINGGMFKRSENVPAKSTVIAVDVESIDETVQKIESRGGKSLMDKAPVGDMGFYAYAQDTENNIIGLWESAKK